MRPENFCSLTVAGIAGVAATLISLLMAAQSYPTRPIELVVHTSAGSGTDVVARALADVVRRETLIKLVVRARADRHAHAGVDEGPRGAGEDHQ